MRKSISVVTPPAHGIQLEFAHPLGPGCHCPLGPAETCFLTRLKAEGPDTLRECVWCVATPFFCIRRWKREAPGSVFFRTEDGSTNPRNPRCSGTIEGQRNSV